MTKELVIQTSPDGVDIALLKDKRLMEIHHESVQDEYTIGDVFVGKIKKLITGLNAAFVDIGHEKEGFLHYHDLGPDVKSMVLFTQRISSGKLWDYKPENFPLEPQIVKTGNIEHVFELGTHIMVQIVKEPISTKGPRLTSQLSYSGRYCVLMPFSNTVSISKKIADKGERDRLKKIVMGIKPKNYGVIVRTNAENVSIEDLQNDLLRLLSDWQQTCLKLSKGENKIYSESGKTVAVLRDFINSSFQRVTVDSQDLYEEAKGYLKKVAPEHEDIIKLYKGDKTLFEHLEIDRQIRGLFNKIVNIGGGAYIVIEHTEAMHVIDVNSGSKRARNIDVADSSFKTNMEAAIEIARQIRLRDMGGIIVIDFIDMRDANHRKQIYEAMISLMADDRAKHTLLPLSKFGILQITRQRVKQEVQSEDSEVCTVCNGTGLVAKKLAETDEIETKLQQYINSHKPKKVMLKVHPYIHAFYTKGLFSRRIKWFLKYGCWLTVIPMPDFLMNQFEITSE